MASLQEQLKAAQIAKAREELRAAKLENYRDAGQLLDTNEALRDQELCFTKVRQDIMNIADLLPMHTTNCHGGKVLYDIRQVIRSSLNEWCENL